MSWPTVPFESVVSRQMENLTQPIARDLWHPKLSHIDAKAGRILSKEYEAKADISPPYFFFNKGNVLLAKFMPELSKVFIADEAGIGGNQWIALQPDTQVLDPQFLAYYLRSPLFQRQAASHSIGFKVPRISEKWLHTHSMPLPPLAEQRRIVMMLDKTSHLLQLQAATNHNAQTVLRAQYLNMFGDPAKNPLHLRKVRLLDLLELEIGKALNESDVNPDGRYPVYGASTKLRRTDQSLCEANTIILTRAGPHCGDVRYTREKAWVTSYAMYVRKKDMGIEDRYLLTALELAQLGKLGGSSNVLVLSTRQVQGAEILLPDLPQQQKFARFAERIAAIVQLQMATDNQLTRLWANLQGQAFSGRLKAKLPNSNLLHNGMKEDSL
jgi:type I restriction enzyme, S subunit